ncbi:sulfatase-like hydrolase/transferase [Stieleria sp. ICT_E10.1]|uniref:sulfatase-like hydrolase/transferase n=1 Tax=Stieleria sedimenti TaxID=2976331 RepID=UPI00218072BA|nr:sulfatase-like hydrolase/transferase [Stieleria sedimenti]MCS7469585.1 sulfatase-like hydrolase/transferase [Stieleria sedimenti]
MKTKVCLSFVCAMLFIGPDDFTEATVAEESRASILTGKYPARTNLTEWLGGRPGRDYEKLHHGAKITALPDEEPTLAEALHQHGYATANYGQAIG